MENPAPEDAIPRGKWQVSTVPPGSSLDRGMCAEKRTDDRPEKGGTLNSGGPGTDPRQEPSCYAVGCDQRTEDAAGTPWESDPPIVVGDGRAVHMAKGRAEGQRGHSTHAREWNTPTRSVSSTLSALGPTDSSGSAGPRARRSEEPGAVVPHAGICEGGAGQPASLPQ
jgi:hypothetical protein